MNSERSNGEPILEFWSQLQQFLDTRQSAARTAGLDGAAYDLLLALKAFPRDMDANISAMSRRLMLQHRVAARTVRRLVRQGLVRTRRSRYDRRSHALQLTPKGERLLGRLASKSLAGLAYDGPPLVASLRHLHISA
ncbi:MAG TPA: helix-turn-helix domain-containing protein [Terriglobales bacterium]|nr:helix-turn-helix domain-containing protein [Terriglobales bacterium]